VRPDILLVISHLASQVTKPNDNDRAALEKVYRYLNGSKDLRVKVKKRTSVNFEVFIDASFGIHTDGTSRTGIMLVVSGVVIAAYSQRQKIVTKSSTEAEIVAPRPIRWVGCALWLREWGLCQGYDVGALVIWQDNQSVLALIARGGRASNRTRHITLTKVVVGRLFIELRTAIFGMV
jgi:hypothetical protein